MKLCVMSNYYIGVKRRAVQNWPVDISVKAHVETADRVVCTELAASAVSGLTFVDICTYSIIKHLH